MKVMLNSKELFDIISEAVAPTKEIEEFIIKIGMFDLITLNEKGVIEPYTDKEIVIKKENE